MIGHANTSPVISILWRVQPTLLLEGLLDMYKKDPTSVPRILDIVQEAKVCIFIIVLIYMWIKTTRGKFDFFLTYGYIKLFFLFVLDFGTYFTC